MSEGATYLLHFVPRYSLRTCGTLVSQTNLERSLLWLDDLAPGQVFVSGSRMITRDEIVSFAAMFDPQPFHIDEEAAKVSLFKGLAASGIHTFGASIRLLLERAPETVFRARSSR
jgi:acyl dehydratase